MIGKILKWFKKLITKEQPSMVVLPQKFRNPTYPSDLADMFPENRNETYTDKVLWQQFGPDDKS